MMLATIQDIVNYQTKRLGKPPGTYSAEQLGIHNVIEKGTSLFQKVKDGKLKIVSLKAKNYNQVVLRIQNPSDHMMAEITGGTLLKPKDSNDQTLICAKNHLLSVHKGQSEYKIETMCYERERSPPLDQEYLLANVRSKYYNQGQSQKQVWEITFSYSNHKVKAIEDWGNKDNLMMMTKEELIGMIAIIATQTPKIQQRGL